MFLSDNKNMKKFPKGTLTKLKYFVFYLLLFAIVVLCSEYVYKAPQEPTYIDLPKHTDKVWI